MKELLDGLKEKDAVEELCKEHSLTLRILKPLLLLSMRGYNNQQIAQKMGVHRITIQRYVSTMRSLKESQFQQIYKYVLNEGDGNEKSN